MKKRALGKIISVVTLILMAMIAVIMAFSFINGYLSQRYNEVDAGYEDYINELAKKEGLAIDVTDKVNFNLDSQLSSSGVWNLYSYESGELGSLSLNPSSGNIISMECLQRNFQVDTTKTYTIQTILSRLKKETSFFMSFGDQVSSTYTQPNIILFNVDYPSDGTFKLCIYSSEPIDFFQDIKIEEVSVNELI